MIDMASFNVQTNKKERIFQFSERISIFVHIGIGKVGKLFSNQGNPLFLPEPEDFYARVYESMKHEGKGQKSGFPAVALE
jgi:hypothetical protein